MYIFNLFEVNFLNFGYRNNFFFEKLHYTTYLVVWFLTLLQLPINTPYLYENMLSLIISIYILAYFCNHLQSHFGNSRLWIGICHLQMYRLGIELWCNGKMVNQCWFQWSFCFKNVTCTRKIHESGINWNVLSRSYSKLVIMKYIAYLKINLWKKFRMGKWEWIFCFVLEYQI